MIATFAQPPHLHHGLLRSAFSDDFCRRYLVHCSTFVLIFFKLHGLLGTTPIICGQPYRSFGSFLRMGLFFKDPNTDGNILSQSETKMFRRTNRRLWFFPFRCANRLCSPSNHFAHSMQYHSPRPGKSSAALVDLYRSRCLPEARSALTWSRSLSKILGTGARRIRYV